MPEQQTYRWVAGPTSADDAARSFARASLRRPRTWAALLAVWLVLGLYLSTTLGDDGSAAARVGRGLLVISLIMAVALPVGLHLGRRATRRRFSQRIGPGVELTSRFGATALELAGPLSSHELAYAGLTRVERVAGWVHLRQVGSRVLLVWPADLFPEHELVRLKRVVGAQARGSSTPA